MLICEERRNLRDRPYEVVAAEPSVTVIDFITTTTTTDELIVRNHRRAAELLVIGPQRALGTGIEAMRHPLARPEPSANRARR